MTDSFVCLGYIKTLNYKPYERMHYLRFEDVNRGKGRTNKISDNKSGNESYKASEIYVGKGNIHILEWGIC